LIIGNEPGSKDGDAPAVRARLPAVSASVRRGRGGEERPAAEVQVTGTADDVVRQFVREEMEVGTLPGDNGALPRMVGEDSRCAARSENHVEPLRVCRRLFGLSQAALAMTSA
jgi:hypothetical protein